MATLQQVAIGIVIFVTIFAGVAVIFTDFAEVYDIQPDATYFNQTGSDNMNDTYALVREIDEKFEESNADQDNIDTSILGGLKAIKKINEMRKLSVNIIQVSANSIGIPNWITNGIIMGILLTVTLAVIGSFIGRRTD